MKAQLDSHIVDCKTTPYQSLKQEKTFWYYFTLYYGYIKAFNGFVLVSLLCALIFIFLDINDPKWRSLYIVLIVVVSWIVGYVDLVIIGFIPLILGPLLGLKTFDEAVAEYFSPTIVLFITATFLAAAITKVGLARRFAYFMMTGSSLQAYDLTWRFYTIGTFISMWIADTASMSLILPIAKELIILVNEFNSKVESDNLIDPRVLKPPKSKMTPRQVEVTVILALAYGTCTGGMMTMIGSGSNFAFLNNWVEDFGYDTPINFTSWMVYGIPMGILTGFFCWLAITLSWDGPIFTYHLFIFFFKKVGYLVHGKDPNRDIPGVKEYYNLRKDKFGKMPPMNFSEKLVIAHFCLTLIIIFLRDPGIPGFGGWDSLVYGGGMTHDALTTSISGVILFVYPLYSQKEVNELLSKDPNPSPKRKKELMMIRLLTWKETQQMIEWGVLFILGGGFCMAAMTVETGLVDILAEGIGDFFTPLSEPTIVLLTLIISAILTEFMSAVVLLQILGPVLNRVAINLQFNPILLSYNAVFATVNGAVTPVATTSNVIATKSCDLKIPELMRTGLLFKVFAILVQYFCIYTYGYPLLDLGTFPDWAQKTN